MKAHPILALLLLATSAQGGPTAPLPVEERTEGGWWFRAAPYGWITAIEGDVGIGPLAAPVDISMSDTLDNLDLAAMGVFEAGYDRFSFGVDLVYGKTSADLAGGDRLFKSFRFEQTQWLVSPFAAYRAVETDRYHMDVFAGARITILEAELTGRFVRGGQSSAESEADWIDPIVGFRGQYDFSDRFFFRYNADIGGFGASSDLIWQAFAGLGYAVNDSLSLAVGYRGLGIDYSRDAFFLDTVTHGPVIGFELRF